MSTYEPEYLLSLWKRQQLDSEMVIGHILQQLVLQQETITRLKRALHELEPDIYERATPLSARPRKRR